ncbi:hypothetical protein HII36_04550 [Nonomuraea sp. NN258]|uniref:hypothetical protein n=1 Tax=Nonomuraea antri TaxID=2730852 RepID=UPI0015683A4A|nr:hypothetical protein [Nonomuraea antri]NRQ31106.1 hypothetical protein [Nonomuraea antri]
MTIRVLVVDWHGLRTLRAEDEPPAVIVLTSFQDDERVAEAVRANATCRAPGQGPCNRASSPGRSPVKAL